MVDLAGFGKKVLSLRRAKGLTVRQLAERVSCSFQYVSAIETGAVASPTIPMVAKVLAGLDAELVLVVKERDRENQNNLKEVIVDNSEDIEIKNLAKKLNKLTPDAKAIVIDIMEQWSHIGISDRRTLRGIIDLWKTK